MYLTLIFLGIVLLIVLWMIKRLFSFRFSLNTRKRIDGLIKSGELPITIRDIKNDDEEYGRLITPGDYSPGLAGAGIVNFGNEPELEEHIPGVDPIQTSAADLAAAPSEIPEFAPPPIYPDPPVQEELWSRSGSQNAAVVDADAHEYLADDMPIGPIEQAAIPEIKVSMSGYFDPETLHFFDNNERVIDAIALLPENDTLVTRNDVLAQYRQIESAFDKHLKLYGLNNSNGRWCEIAEDSTFSYYSDVILTRQLVAGSQPLQWSDWNRFEEIAQELAAALSRKFKLSISGAEAIAEANRLARLVKDFNMEVIMILNSSASSGFSSAGLNYVAKAYGFVPTHDGIFQKYDDGENEPIFSMADAALLHNGFEVNGSHAQNFQSVVLFSVLPRFSDPARAFELMLETALDLGDRLNATVVDQHQNPIVLDSLPIVRQQLSELSCQMLENGIVPGGSNARRLFPQSVHAPEDQLSKLSANPMQNG